VKTGTSGPFAAAVLAGGKSSRFGTDKAFLPWAGRRLIDRQLDLLRALGPTALFISGRAGVDYAIADARVVLDAVPGEGPFGGLAAVLEATTAPHVVVLAVDLPAMTPEFLRQLLDRRTEDQGVVTRSAAGWEPLAAVYPRAILPLVHSHIERREFAVHRLIDAGIAAGLLVEARIADQFPGVFRNVNTPEDLAGQGTPAA
jgi:molybdenum cofactor guanylyltransferase